MCKRFIAGCVLLLLSAAVLAAGQGAGAIAGVWQTKGGGYVQIYRHNSRWVGRIVGSTSGKSRHDKHNPKPAKRGRRLLGAVILKGLSYSGNGEYDDGRVYNPNNGKTYHFKAKMKGPDTLETRGYIGVSLFGKSQTWHRVAPSAKHVHQNLLHRPVAQSG